MFFWELYHQVECLSIISLHTEPLITCAQTSLQSRFKEKFQAKVCFNRCVLTMCLALNLQVAF